ncbi:MAG: GNAT family N-acetyltransferase [bacterium]
MDFTIQQIKPDDIGAIIAIDAIHTGESKPKYWQNRLKPLFEKSNGEDFAVGYVAVHAGHVIGHILAEGRAWEFGSPLCGWIIAIGVHPDFVRNGIALALCKEICSKFKSLGIRTVRTMVRKDNVNVLSFFRASGFHAGPFIELELEI